MPADKNVQDAHIRSQLRGLHGSLIRIVSVMNRPQGDDALIAEAGIRLDRALFPPLVLIERLGPIGVVDLADRVGRDYTTLSRQVAKLESLGLVSRQASVEDRRVRHAVVTPDGKAMTDALDAARGRIARRVFDHWEGKDFDDLVRLMDKLATAMESVVPPPSA